MVNIFTKISIFLEVIVCLLVGFIAFDLEFANIDPDELCILIATTSLILGFIFSIIGVSKEYRKDAASSKRKISLVVAISVPLVAVAAVFAIFATFNY